MNREILFRGKRIDNGEWIFGDISQSQQNIITINPIDSSFMFQDRKEVIPETVGQFVKRINDEMYFDGDIFVIRNLENLRYFIQIDDGEINVHHCIYRDYNNSYLKWGAFGKLKHHNFEKDMTKIGNIHDNPELLVE